VVDEFGGIDILVNNAGIIVRAPLLEHSEQDWDKVIDTDLKGYYLCCHAIAKEMVERKKGNIINIASDQAIRGSPASPVYSIAKAGVVMLTKGLARELAVYNIRVNAIAPGAVRGTGMGQCWWSTPALLKEQEDRIPLGRVAEPSDVANVALFLASDASRHITGDTIVVDGGLLT
jgi:NAD(P)-dependent dehydrogenase (short-subunit alcohol dehydrogenase family)